MTDHAAHDHVFGQDAVRAGERRTVVVVALTAAMMAVEIAAGAVYGSMALLADGLHMASHAAALAIAAFAYRYARSHAADCRYSFGTGKVNALAGFSSGIILLGFALFMGWESVLRFVRPVRIDFDQAILVAVAGLAVNAASVFILGGYHERGEDRGAGNGGYGAHDAHGGVSNESRAHDHNLRAAYLHVLADAVTSVLAIIALLAGKFAGLAWMDPLMGLAGAALVTRWSAGLLRQTGGVLLDVQAPASLEEAARLALEREPGTRVTDLHLWCIGPGNFAAEIVLVSREPKSPEHYRSLLPPELGLVHATVEVHPENCPPPDQR